MDLLGIRTVPYVARRNYLWEFRHLLAWGMLAGLVEGQFASVVVSRSFHGGPLLIAIASATPVAAHLSSLAWGMLCVGRPKLRLFGMFGAGTVLFAAAAAATPATALGAWLFILQMAAAQVMLTGVVTVRAALWRLNYPQASRGRITARLQAVRFVVATVSVLLAAVACDKDPENFRWVYPVAAACGAAGLTLLRRMRARGEGPRAVRRRQRLKAGADRADLAEPFDLTVLLTPGRVLRNMAQVLRRDTWFARYCLAQSVLGISNLMTTSVLVAVVTKELSLGTSSGFWVSTVLIEAMPKLLLFGSLSYWGKLFDRFGVLRFRVVNCACWFTAMLCGLLANLVVAYQELFGTWFVVWGVMMFALRGLMQGLGQGGGSIAWNLGHLHFARSEQAEVYMGIHVSLTGLRGLLAPAAGMLLYELVGWPVWLVAMALSFLSLILFARMAQEERARLQAAAV